MRSAILWGFGVFLVVVAGAVSISWYAQASGSKAALEDFVAKLNSEERLISYESIETSGFPSQVVITIERPRFYGNVDKFLNKLSPHLKDEAQKAQLSNLPQWHEDFYLDGYLIITVNALSDFYSISSIGNWQSTSKVNGKVFASIHEQASHSFCSLQLKRGSIFGNLWDFSSMVRDGEKFLNDFRLFDCAFPATSTLETNTRTPLSSTGPARFYISNAPSTDAHHIRVYLTAADIEVTPEGDKSINTFMSALSPGQYHIPRKISAYGKQKLDIDFAYDGPKSFDGASNPQMEINLSRFEVSNLAYNTLVHFFFSNGMVENLRNTQISFRAESNFTSAYDSLLQEMLRTGIDEIYTNPEIRTPEMEYFINTYNQDQMYAIISPSVPNFESLGKAVQSFDAEFKGDAAMQVGDFTLNNLELSFTPYGIRMVGTGHNDGKKPANGHININCANCNQLIDDMMLYYERLHKTLSYFSPDLAMNYRPGRNVAEGIKSFLYDISGADKVNLSFDVVLDATNGVTINGRGLNIMTNKYYQYIAPALKENARKATRGNKR